MPPTTTPKTLEEVTIEVTDYGLSRRLLTLGTRPLTHRRYGVHVRSSSVFSISACNGKEDSRTLTQTPNLDPNHNPNPNNESPSFRR